jgi:hypothetical protein
MTLQDLFDQLLTDREAVVVMERAASENLRVQLAKKWSKYKRDLDELGFLSEDLAACSLQRRQGETDMIWVFKLAPKTTQTISYQVLPPTSENEL